MRVIRANQGRRGLMLAERGRGEPYKILPRLLSASRGPVYLQEWIPNLVAPDNPMHSGQMRAPSMRRAASFHKPAPDACQTVRSSSVKWN